jgi:hypothetical protein
MVLVRGHISAQGDFFRRLVLWCYFCRVLLHDGVGLDGLLLHRLWLFTIGLAHRSFNMCLLYSNRDNLLSASARGLPVVVDRTTRVRVIYASTPNCSRYVYYPGETGLQQVS